MCVTSFIFPPLDKGTIRLSKVQENPRPKPQHLQFSTYRACSPQPGKTVLPRQFRSLDVPAKKKKSSAAIADTWSIWWLTGRPHPSRPPSQASPPATLGCTLLPRGPANYPNNYFFSWRIYYIKYGEADSASSLNPSSLPLLRPGPGLTKWWEDIVPFKKKKKKVTLHVNTFFSQKFYWGENYKTFTVQCLQSQSVVNWFPKVYYNSSWLVLLHSNTYFCVKVVPSI